MKQKILLVLIAISFLTINSCKDDIVGPQPGRRDYVWTVDTIKIFSNYIHQIWGSAPDNIWGVGPGGALNTTIWHYDGKAWTTDYVSRNISPECVYGFSENDVWIAGQNGKIWRYNGMEWKENYAHKVSETANVFISDLYGTSNYDLYAVGTVWYNNETRRGIILYYDGVRWTQKFLADFNSLFYRVTKDFEGNCIINCIKQDVFYNSRDTTVFYKYDGNVLKEIYSDKDKSVKQGWVTTIQGKTYLSLDNGIYNYENNSLKQLFGINNNFYAVAILGRNEKDIILGMSDGIYHYNGQDTKLLFSTGDFITGGILFDTEIFLLNTNLQNGMSFIYNGKLKE